MENKYYLYRHVRLDKNVPFYVGIGTKTKDNLKYGTYTRAHSIRKKNVIWNSIVNKTDYIVDILLETNDYEFLKQKEIEFVALYGRIDLETGILSNMTNGGEGTKNVIVSEYSRNLRSIHSKGRIISKESTIKRLNTRLVNSWKFPEESKRKIALTKSKPVLQFSLTGELLKVWDKLLIASETLNIPKYVISTSANSKNRKSFTGQNYIWLYQEDYEKGVLDKFNIALERVKLGKVKTFYSEIIKDAIISNYNTMDKNITKTNKLKTLSKLFKMNFSTIRAIIKKFKC